MAWNTPDDWGNYYYTCDICGNRAHASEGDCCEVCVECEDAGQDDENTGLCESCAERLEEDIEKNKQYPDMPI